MTEEKSTDLIKRQQRDIFLRHYANAQAFFSAQNYQESFKEIRRAGEIDPLNSKLAYLAMEIFKRTQNGDGLVTLSQKMLETDPDDTIYRYNKALGFFFIENYAVTIDEINHLLDTGLNENEEVLCIELLADAYRKKNDFEKAKSNYLKILEKADNPGRILVKLTSCYYRLNDHKNVVVTTGRLIEMGYNDENIVSMYEKAVEKTKTSINGFYKPKNFLQKLFRGGYDPVYAKLMNLEIEKENLDRRVDIEQRKRFTDPLTGANNRAFFDEKILPFFTDTTLPKETVFCFLFFDIDKFKSVNDEYGHKTGDAVLTEYSKIGRDFFKQVVPGSEKSIETWCRYGGEEFVALYFGDKAEAFKKADEFRMYVQSTLHVKVLKNHKLTIRIITCSGGLSEFPTEAKDFIAAHELADKRLYFAKNNGRNQIVKDGQEFDKVLPEKINKTIGG